MERLRELWRGLRVFLFRRERFERDLEEEMQFHLDMQAEENQENGMDAEEARYAAKRQFGNAALLKEASREMWGWGVVERVIQDLRYAARMMRRTPAFTAVAVLTLALGIGANTAIFSVANAVLWRSLPYEDPNRLATVWETCPKLNLGFDELPVSAANFLDWRQQARVFEQLALFRPQALVLTGAGEPERVVAARVSANFFALLGVQPLLGRAFLAEEDRAGKNDVVVMSYGLWRRRFGGDPAVIGRKLVLNDVPFIVVGITPPGFGFPKGPEMPVYFRFAPQTDLWRPAGLMDWEASPTNRGDKNFAVIGRLRRGVRIDQAQADMNTIAARIAEQYPDSKDWGVKVVRFSDSIVGPARAALLVLFGAVGFVLLIACANVANLLLARSPMRGKEIAVRLSLGASRLRIVLQLLTESVVLAVAGGALAVLIAYPAIDALVASAGARIPRLDEVRLDAGVLGFAAAISLLTGVLFGLVPALRASKPDLNSALKEGGRSIAGLAGRSGRALLVAAETSLCLVLLAGAGLMIKSFVKLTGIDPGLRKERVLTMQIALYGARYGEGSRRAQFFQEVLRRVEAIPGVESAGMIDTLPFTGDANVSDTSIEGRHPTRPTDAPLADYRAVSPDYFRAMGVPLRKGLFFGVQDTAESAQVAIVGETGARQFWPGEEPIGKRLKRGDNPKTPWCTVIGVVGDVTLSGLGIPPRAQVYRPLTQYRPQEVTLSVRSAIEPAQLAAALRQEIWKVDKDQPVSRVKTMEQIVSDSVAPRRFQTLLLLIFAGLALVLASVGTYGVISHSVTERTHEIGIRMALGAQRGAVVKLVIRQGMLPALIGAVIGLAAALAASRVLSSFLYGVTSRDPATFVLASLVLLATALFASYIPARRASRLDPLVALRYE